MNEKQRKDICDVLESYATSTSNQSIKYGIYIKDKPIYLYGGKNVYSSVGIAKRKILEHTIYGIKATSKAYQPYREALDSLIEEGIISIKPLQ